MNNTALGAENKKEQIINFISEAHEKFYYEKLKEVRYQDVYHKALCYCLGIDCMKNTTTKIANIKAYMVTTLYNAPNTLNHYYQQEVQHDMYGGGWHEKDIV